MPPFWTWIIRFKGKLEPETPIFNGKKTIKSMGSCRLSLKPIQWWQDHLLNLYYRWPTATKNASWSSLIKIPKRPAATCFSKNIHHQAPIGKNIEDIHRNPAFYRCNDLSPSLFPPRSDLRSRTTGLPPTKPMPPGLVCPASTCPVDLPRRIPVDGWQIWLTKWWNKLILIQILS